MLRATSLSAAALAAALLALPARAADPKPAAAPAAAAAPAPKVASDLARVLATKEAWSQGVEGLSRMVQGQFAGHPGSSLTLPPGFDKKVRSEVEAILPYDKLVDIHAKQLAATYSEPEMNELLAHYRSPLGQKWLKEMPAVSQKIAAETQKQVDPKLGELMNKLAKDVKPPAEKAGAKAPAKKAAAPAKPAAK